MKEKVILLIDDDYKKEWAFFTYSKIIEEGSFGCKVLEKDEIQNLLNSLNKNLSDIENQKKLLESGLEIDKKYDVLAFILDVELETNPFDGISILHMIINGEIYPVTERIQKFFCSYIPKIIFTSKDDIKTKYENIAWVLNKNTLCDKKFKKDLENEIKTYLENISKNKREYILNDIYLLLKEVNNDVKDIKENTKIISQMIAKSLPLLTDKNKAKKIIERWEQDPEFKYIMKDCKIEKPENLFNKLNTLKEKLTNNAKENLAEMLYEEVTQFFESEAEIDEKDDRLIKFLKYSTYAVEKIGEVLHKK